MANYSLPPPSEGHVVVKLWSTSHAGQWFQHLQGSRQLEREIKSATSAFFSKKDRVGDILVVSFSVVPSDNLVLTWLPGHPYFPFPGPSPMLSPVHLGYIRAVLLQGVLEDQQPRQHWKLVKIQILRLCSNPLDLCGWDPTIHVLSFQAINFLVTRKFEVHIVSTPQFTCGLSFSFKWNVTELLIMTCFFLLSNL